MSQFARVTSIGVLQTVASAVQKFRGESAAAIDDLAGQLRRAQEWIHHDRKTYWSQELYRSQETVSQARVQLQQARISRRIAGHEPACIDEQRALDRAKRRQTIAEEKCRAVQHWEIAIDRAVEEFQQNRTRFITWLDTDMLRAVTVLDRMSETLEKYISLAVPESSVLPPPTDENSPPNSRAEEPQP
jgi:hypothetical protein